MPEDIRSLATWVTEAEWPQVACPACRVGTLAPEELHRARSAASEAIYDASSDPLEIEGTFHGRLRCSFSKCHEPVIVVGDYHVVSAAADHNDRHAEPYDHVYRLRYVQPPLELIVPPNGTPDAVALIVRSAGLVVWADPGAAANRLRLAIEELLTEYGMPRFENRNGHRERLSTHRRIVDFKKYEGSVADVLEAVKWIGNTGTHESKMTVDEVLEGAGLLFFALRLLYDSSDEELERRANRINKRNRRPAKKATKAQS